MENKIKDFVTNIPVSLSFITVFQIFFGLGLNSFSKKKKDKKNLSPSDFLSVFKLQGFNNEIFLSKRHKLVMYPVGNLW